LEKVFFNTYAVGLAMTKIDNTKNKITTVIVLSAIAFVLSYALISGSSISVLAAPNNGSSSSNHTMTLANTLVQNLPKTNVPVALP